MKNIFQLRCYKLEFITYLFFIHIIYFILYVLRIYNICCTIHVEIFSQTWNNDLAAAAKAYVEACSVAPKLDTCGIGNYAQLHQLLHYLNTPIMPVEKVMREALRGYKAQGKNFTLTSNQCGNDTCLVYRQVRKLME